MLARESSCTALVVPNREAKLVKSRITASGEKRYMQGREPLVTADGQPLVDRLGRRSFVTSAGAGPSIGKHILMAYLPQKYAQEKTKLFVEYMTERYPVTVAAVGRTPSFDPDDERMKR